MPPTAESSASAAAARDRWGEFLGTAVTIAQASGGAVWEFDNGRLRLSAQLGLGDQRLDQAQQNWPGHSEKLADVVRSRESKTLSARFEPEGNGGVQDLRLLLVPLTDGEAVDAVVELFLPELGGLPLDQVERSIRQMARWQSQAESAADGAAGSLRPVHFAAWLARIHASLSLDETAVALANETRTWSGWDRVTLAVRFGSSLPIRCISGLETFDRRSDAVRQLETVLSSLRQQTKPLVISTAEETSTAAGPLESQVFDYARRVSATQVALVPLLASAPGAKSRPIGMLVFENFQPSDEGRRPPKELEFASQQAALALEHALEYERARAGFITRSLRGLGSWTFLRRAGVFAGLAAVVLTLSFLRTDLVITGTGSLEPERQQDVFAVVQGIINELSVKHGQDVDAGAKLLTLRSVELEFEVNKLEGELETVKQQITDLEALRSDPRRAAERAQYGPELAARAEELRSVQKNLEQQLAILNRQNEDLTLRSPLTGRVITWDLEKLLSDRPVNRSDRLLTVADLGGPWQVRLHVDHRDTGPVLTAIDRGDIRISFVTAAAPETAVEARLRETAPALTVDPLTGTTLTLLADVDRSSVAAARPGTTVLYRLHCGESPIGYVWFRRLIDRVTAWWALL